MRRRLAAIAVAVLITSAGCSSPPQAVPEATIGCEAIDPVRLQLQWSMQAQFAGYVAAVQRGYYEERCLDVVLIAGGPDISPQDRLADGKADFAVSFVPKALVSRRRGANLVEIAQVFQRSGTLQVTLENSGITEPADFADQRIAAWGLGNGYEVLASISQAGLDPSSDVDVVRQTADLEEFIYGDYDVAQVMTYHEYGLLLARQNPLTRLRFQPEDLNVIDLEEIGAAMLQDSIWADGDRLDADPLYRDVAVRFLAASFQGWVYCRDRPVDCRDMVLRAGSDEGPSLQLWQMNEINRLIWPSPEGIGHIDQDAWDRTVSLLRETLDTDGEPLLERAPGPGAHTNEYVEAAWRLLGGIDIGGNSFVPLDGVNPFGGS